MFLFVQKETLLQQTLINTDFNGYHPIEFWRSERASPFLMPMFARFLRMFHNEQKGTL